MRPSQHNDDAGSVGGGSTVKLHFGAGAAHRHPLRLSSRAREAEDEEEVARARALGLVVGARPFPAAELAASTDRLYKDAFQIRQRQALATAAKEQAFSYHPAITSLGASMTGRATYERGGGPVPLAARIAAAEPGTPQSSKLHAAAQPRYQMLYENASAMVSAEWREC